MKTLTALLLLASFHLSAQQVDFGVYSAAGVTNLFDHYPNDGAKRGPTFELGLISNITSNKENGFIASFQLGASHSSYSFTRFNGVLAANAKLVELNFRSGVGYSFRKFQLLPFFELRYTMSGRFEGFVTRESSSPFSTFEVSYGSVDEVGEVRIGVEDEYRLYADLGISLRYAISKQFGVGLALSNTISNADFAFTSSELCRNGDCPDLTPIGTFTGGWATKFRTTGTATVFYYFN